MEGNPHLLQFQPLIFAKTMEGKQMSPYTVPFELAERLAELRGGLSWNAFYATQLPKLCDILEGKFRMVSNAPKPKPPPPPRPSREERMAARRAYKKESIVRCALSRFNKGFVPMVDGIVDYDNPLPPHPEPWKLSKWYDPAMTDDEALEKAVDEDMAWAAEALARDDARLEAQWAEEDRKAAERAARDDFA